MGLNNVKGLMYVRYTDGYLTLYTQSCNEISLCVMDLRDT